MKTVFIYALNDPNRQHLGKTRYIGKAEDPYDRYDAHMKNSRREKSHKANWIRSLQALGNVPVLEVLDEVPENEWEFWEKEWIRLYRALGFQLTNGTDGGEGGNPTPETRAKLSLAQRGRSRGPHALDTRLKIGRAHLGMKRSAETCHRISISKTGKKINADRGGEKSYWFGKTHSEETLSKMRAVHVGKIFSTGTRAKMSATKAGKNNPNYGKTASAETRAKRSASLRASWAKRKGIL